VWFCIVFAWVGGKFRFWSIPWAEVDGSGIGGNNADGGGA